MSTFWKIFLSILGLIVIAGGIFCLVALIVGTLNDVGFVEQIRTWFGIVKEVPKDETVVTSMLNLFR